MPTRATKRGADRTRLERDCDVLVCGASFAGLAVAAELAGSGARVLVLDRYEIGERQTSACGIPSQWLTALDLGASERQRFDELVVHTPWRTARWPLPWSFSTFDYRELCGLLWERCGDADFETATVTGRLGDTVLTDRGGVTAPLLRSPTEAAGFFAAASPGIALTLTAEGIRTALYFGIACGRELRAVVAGSRSRDQALRGYGAFSDSHERKFRWLLAVQRAIGQITPSRAVTQIVRAFESRRLTGWAFDQYLAIAPPSYVGAGPGGNSASPRASRRIPSSIA